MKVVFLLLVLLAPVHSNDRFNYDKTNLTERDFGPSDWGEVACEDVETCVSSEAIRERGKELDVVVSHTSHLVLTR
jgi:hypothetical protein